MTSQKEVEVPVVGDKKIISDIRERNEKTFEYVVDRYSKLVWKIASSILINASSICEVEECVADVFIYLWEYPEKFDPEKGKLSSWLSMIARSRAIDRFRRILKEKQVSFDEAQLLLEKEQLSIDDDNRADKLKECIDKLGSEEKEIIIRRFYYEQKNREIALAMGMKPKQIENHIYNAKNKLRKMMEE